MHITPLHKAAVLQWILSFIAIGPICAVSMLLLLRSSWWSVGIAYAAWQYWDRDACKRGGRRLDWVRRWRVWRLMAEYFPAKLHKTQTLSSEANYILGFHPHGVLSAGAFLHFASEATGFSQKFPGIRPYLTVLEGHFDFPFYRDYLMLSGAISVKRDSLQYVLNKRKSGQLLCVIPGGAYEALDAKPGSHYRIHLRNRLGFVRMAIQTGSNLVPCFSFGEIDVFNQVSNSEGTLLRSVQNFLMRVFGFSMPIFSGHGLLPFSKPINSVVGSPITVSRNPDPSETEVKELMQRYIAELQQLFDEHKATYVGQEASLEIL